MTRLVTLVAAAVAAALTAILATHISIMPAEPHWLVVERLWSGAVAVAVAAIFATREG